MELWFKLRFYSDIIGLIILGALILLVIIVFIFNLFRTARIEKYMKSHGYERKLYRTPNVYYWVKSSNSKDYVLEKILFNMKFKDIKNKYK